MLHSSSAEPALNPLALPFKRRRRAPLRHHGGRIVAADFFVVPTVTHYPSPTDRPLVRSMQESVSHSTIQFREPYRDRGRARSVNQATAACS